MRTAGVLLVLLLLAGCSAPRDTTYDDTRLIERIDQLSQQNQELRADLSALRTQLDTDTAYLNSQLSTLQTNYDLLWDSYQSIFDYLIAQSEGRMMDEP